ncbi:MAG: nucleotidyltransferase domain-containing protein [Candidatus Woesearchaeota archaeon]
MLQKSNNIALDIIELLVVKDLHLRAISRTLSYNPSTVLSKLNSLMEDNILDYRREGKNKIFFLKKNQWTKNYLVQMECHKALKFFRKKQEFSVIFEEILMKTDAQLVLLFGSYAKGTEKGNSDIDIYANTKNIRDVKEIRSIHARIRATIGELQKDTELFNEIMNNHIVIRGAEKLYEEYWFPEKTGKRTQNKHLRTLKKPNKSIP